MPCNGHLALLQRAMPRGAHRLGFWCAPFHALLRTKAQNAAHHTYRSLVISAAHVRLPSQMRQQAISPSRAGRTRSSTDLQHCLKLICHSVWATATTERGPPVARDPRRRVAPPMTVSRSCRDSWQPRFSYRHRLPAAPIRKSRRIRQTPC